MIKLIISLSDRFLFINRFMDNLLEAFISQKKDGFKSIAMLKIERDRKCREEILKINHYNNNPDSIYPKPRIVK